MPFAFKVKPASELPEAQKIASSPFNKTTADTILRTSDNIDFYVFRVVLCLASSFFETMFSLQQPAPRETNTVLDDRPVIEVSENSQIIDALLRFCYPVPDPVIKDLSKLDNVLGAALKYDTSEAVLLLRALLRGFVTLSPREVYAIACRHNLEEEARLAALTWHATPLALDRKSVPEFTKTIPGVTYVPEMVHISAGQYYRLLRYRRNGPLATFSLFFPPFCRPSSRIEAPSTTREMVGIEKSSPFSRSDTDMVIRSSDNINFHVHEFILTLAEADTFINQGEQVRTPVADLARCVRVDVHSDVLGVLLRLCYPNGVTSPEFGSLSSRTYSNMIHTASKYHMKPVLQAVRSSWKQDVDRDPLTSYLLAAQLGWDAEAQQAAEHLLSAPLEDLYVPEMERTTADVYQRLLMWHHQCQVAGLEASASHGKSFYDHESTLTGGQWKREWLNATSGKYVRSVPCIFAELELAKHNSSRWMPETSMSSMIAKGEQLQNDMKAASQKVSIQTSSSY